MNVIETTIGNVHHLYLAEYVKNRKEYRERFDRIYYIGYIAKKRKVRLDIEKVNCDYIAMEYEKNKIMIAKLILRVIEKLKNKKKICIMTDKKDASGILKWIKVNIDNYVKSRDMNSEERDILAMFVRERKTELLVFETIWQKNYIDIGLNDKGDIVFITDRLYTWGIVLIENEFQNAIVRGMAVEI